MKWKEFVKLVEEILQGKNPEIEYIDWNCGYSIGWNKDISINLNEEKNTLTIL